MPLISFGPVAETLWIHNANRFYDTNTYLVEWNTVMVLTYRNLIRKQRLKLSYIIYRYHSLDVVGIHIGRNQEGTIKFGNIKCPKNSSKLAWIQRTLWLPTFGNFEDRCLHYAGVVAYVGYY